MASSRSVPAKSQSCTWNRLAAVGAARSSVLLGPVAKVEQIEAEAEPSGMITSPKPKRDGRFEVIWNHRAGLKLQRDTHACCGRLLGRLPQRLAQPLEILLGERAFDITGHDQRADSQTVGPIPMLADRTTPSVPSAPLPDW